MSRRRAPQTDLRMLLTFRHLGSISRIFDDFGDACTLRKVPSRLVELFNRKRHMHCTYRNYQCNYLNFLGIDLVNFPDFPMIFTFFFEESEQIPSARVRIGDGQKCGVSRKGRQLTAHLDTSTRKQRRSKTYIASYSTGSYPLANSCEHVEKPVRRPCRLVGLFNGGHWLHDRKMWNPEMQPWRRNTWNGWMDADTMLLLPIM